MVCCSQKVYDECAMASKTSLMHGGFYRSAVSFMHGMS